MNQENKLKLEQSILKILKDNTRKIYDTSVKDISRAPEKVDSLHANIASKLHYFLNDNNFDFKTKYFDKKESNIEGYFYKKRIDIEIFKKDLNQCWGTIEVKFNRSSLMKNKNNGISNMIGEALNIKMNGMKTFWIIFMPRHSFQSFNNNKTNWYEITNKSLEPYKWMYRKNVDNRDVLPDLLSINIYDEDIIYNENLKQSDVKNIYIDNSKFQNLEFKFLKEFEYECEGLYINKYSDFIEKIVEEIKNEK